MYFFQNDFKAMFPEIFLGVAILAILTYGVIYSTSGKHSFPLMIRPALWLAVLSLMITIILVINNPLSNQTLANNLLIIDNFTSFTKLIVLGSSLIVLIMSVDFIKKEKINFFEYAVLILLSVLGMLFIISSYDLMTMYLAIEFQSLCLYVLAAFKRNSMLSAEAGLKYFILGAFASGILLFGISLVYGFTGLTSFEDLAKLLTFANSDNLIVSTGLVIGMIFIGVALLFKIYAVPFHVWVPDVYEGSPTIVTAFFAITPSISVLSLLIRLMLSTFYDFISYWQPVLLFCAIGSMLIGSVVALTQYKIKRLLAYSAISHVGYVLLGIASGTPEGIQSLLVYVVIYIAMSINFFTVILSLRKAKGTTVEKLNEFTGLYKINPMLAVTLALVLFSMAGIPPLAGFFSKLYIFLAAIQSSLLLPVFIGIVASIIGSVYYLRIVKLMYFDKPIQWTVFEQIDKQKSIILAITFLFLVFFFLYPSPLLLASHKAALTICL
jgi:NADH-quinone oxidoreductase subunit N